MVLHLQWASLPLQHCNRTVPRPCLFPFSTFKRTVSFLEGFDGWRWSSSNIIRQLVGQGFNELLQGFSSPSIFHRLSSVVKNKLKVILDVTCINVALPGSICLQRRSMSHSVSFTTSPSVFVPGSERPRPFLQSALRCHSPIQHIKEPRLVPSAGRPPVSFTLGPNEKCPF